MRLATLAMLFAVSMLLLAPALADEKIKVIIAYKSLAGKLASLGIAEGIAAASQQQNIAEEDSSNIDADKRRIVAASQQPKIEPDYIFSQINAVSAEISQEELEVLRNNPDIAYIEISLPVHALLQDSMPLVRANNSWKLQSNGLNLTGASQTICVLDTGINYTHPDFGGCSAGEFLAGTCSKIPGGYDFCADNDNCSTKDSIPEDVNGHGTHVSGIIAADGGIKGVAPNAKIIPIKVLNETGWGSSADMNSGIDWCINNSATYNISAISMSLGSESLYSSYCDSYDPSTTSLINQAIAKNISVIAASGNDGNTTHIASPACIENATAVGASTKSDEIAGFSNRNSLVDLLAPGEKNINSTYLSGYATLNGTSMATPHVSGAVAILSQYSKLSGRNLSPSEMESALKSSGKKIYDSKSGMNYSRIDLYAALVYLDIPPIIILNFPQNNSNITHATILNFTISDDFAVSSSWYEFNSTNTSFSGLINASSLGAKGQKNITIWANDTSGNTTSAGFVFYYVNNFPVAENITISPSNATKFSPLNCTYIYSDADGDEENGTIISWYINSILNSTLTSAFVPENLTLKNQNWTCSVLPKDGTDFGNQANATITIGNLPPVWNSYAGNFSVLEDSQINITLSANDSDGDAVSYSANVSYGSMNSSSGIFSWIPTNEYVGATWIRFGASDGMSTIYQTAKIEVNNTNDAPVLQPIGQKTATAGSEFLYVVDAYDPDVGDILAYSANTTLFAINTSTGTIRFTPTSAQIGNYLINISVSDSYISVSAIMNLTIRAAALPQNTSDEGGGGSGIGGSNRTASQNITQQANASVVSQSEETGYISKTFEALSSGSTASLEVNGDALIGVDVKVSAGISSAEIKAREIAGKPAGINSAPEGEVYKYFEIKTTIPDTAISSASIKFKVSRLWMNSSSIDANTISLLRHDSEWKKIKPSMANIDASYNYYEAETSGFSYFAIAGLKKEEAGKKAGSIFGQLTGAVATTLSAEYLGVPNYGLIMALVLAVVMAVLVSQNIGRIKPRKKIPRGRLTEEEKNYYKNYFQE